MSNFFNLIFIFNNFSAYFTVCSFLNSWDLRWSTMNHYLWPLNLLHSTILYTSCTLLGLPVHLNALYIPLGFVLQVLHTSTSYFHCSYCLLPTAYYLLLTPTTSLLLLLPTAYRLLPNTYYYLPPTTYPDYFPSTTSAYNCRNIRNILVSYYYLV